MVLRYFLDQRGAERRTAAIHELTPRPMPTVLIGMIGGVIVGMTSVGSGSLMIILLLFLYPMIGAKQLVGTDLTQAVPLTAAAALGALAFGHVEFAVTLSLIIGSVPAVLVGSMLSSSAPDRYIRPVITFVIFASGLKYVGLGTTALGWVLVATLAGAFALLAGLLAALGTDLLKKPPGDEVQRGLEQRATPGGPAAPLARRVGQRRRVAQERLDLEATSRGLFDERNRVEAAPVTMHVLASQRWIDPSFAAAQILVERLRDRPASPPRAARRSGSRAHSLGSSRRLRRPSARPAGSRACRREPRRRAGAASRRARRLRQRLRPPGRRRSSRPRARSAARCAADRSADRPRRGSATGRRRPASHAGRRERPRSRLPELGREHLGERRASRHVVLPELALGLMDRHRRAVSEVRTR